MRTRIGWLALLLTVGLALAPTTVWGQETHYEVPVSDPVFPFPLSSPRPELGGFFFASEFIYWRQTNPLKDQIIAVRGYVDSDGSITGTPGTFVGIGRTALDSINASGPGTYVPGYRMTLGYTFQNGLAVDLSNAHLVSARYTTGATGAPPATFPPFNQGFDAALANTVLYSPVFNFPSAFAGPNGSDLGIGSNRAPYGIWNAAKEETIKFDQRLDRWEIRARVPIWQSEEDDVQDEKTSGRVYGLTGVRRTWLWERFQWRVTDATINGQADASDVAIYNNILSQPMYGPFVGWGCEKYLGHGWAISVESSAALYTDFVRKEVSYERGDEEEKAKRAIRDYNLVPELQAEFNLWWYPIEGVQIKWGYSFIGLFNTISSPYPVDFNFTGLTPVYKRQGVRVIDGMNVGICFDF